MVLRKLVYEIDADDNTGPALDSFQRAVREAARSAARDLENVGDAAEDLEDDLEDVGQGGAGAMETLRGAAAIAGGAAGVGALLTSVTETALEVGRLADATGLSVEQVSALQNVANSSGVEFDALVSSFRTLQDRMVDVRRGGVDSIEMFEALGVSVDDILRLEPADQFSVIAQALEGIEDPTLRAGLASQLLGDDYIALTSVLAGTDDTIRELIDSEIELGRVLTEDQVDAARRANAAWADLKVTLQSIVAEALPPLVAGFEQAREAALSIGEVTGFTTTDESQIDALLESLGFGDDVPGRTSGRVPRGRGGPPGAGGIIDEARRIGPRYVTGVDPFGGLADDRFYEQPYDPALGTVNDPFRHRARFVDAGTGLPVISAGTVATPAEDFRAASDRNVAALNLLTEELRRRAGFGGDRYGTDPYQQALQDRATAEGQGHPGGPG